MGANYVSHVILQFYVDIKKLRKFQVSFSKKWF